MIDYKLLEAFYYTINEGGFEKAADKLCITQSAVSQRIKLLEEQVGQVLLMRSIPPKPTPIGFNFYNHYNKVKHLETELFNDNKNNVDLTLALNDDSLATWFYPTILPLIDKGDILKLYVDDQDITIDLLKNGIVIGCISTYNKSLNGCSMRNIGSMKYRLVATNSFIEKWFKMGFSLENIKHAPGVIFDHKDNLHERHLENIFKQKVAFPFHMIPSSEKLYNLIQEGFGYGLISDLQRQDNDGLIDITPEHYLSVDLYLHNWNYIPDSTKAILDNLIEKIHKSELIY